MINLEVENNDVDLEVSDLRKGADGITPEVFVTDITDGHNVLFYYGADDSRNKNFDVMNGEQGDPGETGPAGPGLAPGGTTGQILEKNSNDDYDTRWVDKEGGSLYVTFTSTGGSIVAGYTVSEIIAAFNSGKAVYGFYQGTVYYLAFIGSTSVTFRDVTQTSTSQISQYILSMSGLDSNVATFSSSYFTAPTEVMSITWTYKSGGWRSSRNISEISTAFMNGQAIIGRNDHKAYYLAVNNGTVSGEFRTMPEIDISGSTPTITIQGFTFLTHDSTGSWWQSYTRTLTGVTP